MACLRFSLPLLLALAGCGSSGDPAEGPLRVLFIGNSLTYANDLPAMVAALAGPSAGAVRIEVQDASNPNYALEDHWADPRTMDALDQGGWDVVVLQQGPSSLPENQANLRDFATRFADRIRSLGGAPALYMVWPDVTRLSFFDAVSLSYRAAAEAAGAALYPAGEAWRAAWLEDASLTLYGGDGYHPSVLGSYLAALTIYRGLTHRSVIGALAPEGVSGEVAAILQRAAEQATAQFGRP
jgi:hypothetical protein